MLSTLSLQMAQGGVPGGGRPMTLPASAPLAPWTTVRCFFSFFRAIDTADRTRYRNDGNRIGALAIATRGTVSAAAAVRTQAAARHLQRERAAQRRRGGVVLM